MRKKKLFKISTVPCSLKIFLSGQLKMLSEHFDVVAVSSPGEDLDSIRESDGVRTIAIPMQRRISILKDIVSLFRLIFLFIKERPYIVHSMTPKAGLLCMVAAKLTFVPVRIHTFTGLVFPTATGKMQKLLILMDKITCFCANYINPEGEGVKRDLQKFKITNKPLHIIANGNVKGIDLDYFSLTDEVKTAAEKLTDRNVFTFCFVGRIVKDKGINELAYAFSRLYNEYKNIRLILVGDIEEELDPLTPESLEIIKSHTTIKSVGYQNDIRPFLAASDALVFPSYREGFPNVVIEAGAMGLASIVTNINGSNEIIIEGKNGEIIPPHDKDALYNKMKEWLKNPKKVKEMSSKARKLIADRYEQKMIWNALLKEYLDIVSKK